MGKELVVKSDEHEAMIEYIAELETRLDVFKKIHPSEVLSDDNISQRFSNASNYLKGAKRGEKRKVTETTVYSSTNTDWIPIIVLILGLLGICLAFPYL